MDPEKVKIIEEFWVKLEEQTEEVLLAHSAEVHAVAQALLERNDLTGKQCIEIIRSAAVEAPPFDGEVMLKALVEETIIDGKNGKNGKNGKSGKKPTVAKRKPVIKIKE